MTRCPASPRTYLTKPFRSRIIDRDNQDDQGWFTMPDAWILPKNNQSVLWVRPDATHYRHAEGPILEKGPVPMPLRAVHWLDIERDRLVYALDGKLHLLPSLLGQTKPATVKISGTPRVHALHVVDDVVFSGADAGKGMLGFWDLRAPQKWQAIDVSSEVNWTGKGIDGFAVFGSKLIAIDDIVLPRFLLILDITNPRQPQWIEHRDLPAHSSYERIQSVCANDRIVVMLSSTANHGATAHHIAFMDLASLREYAVLSVQGTPSFRKWADRSYDLHGIALQGNRLLIAAGNDGLAIMDVPLDDPDVASPKPKDRAPFSNAPRLSDTNLRFVSVSQGPVVGVSAVDDKRAFVIVEKNGTSLFERTQIDSLLVELPQSDHP